MNFYNDFFAFNFFFKVSLNVFLQKTNSKREWLRKSIQYKHSRGLEIEICLICNFQNGDISYTFIKHMNLYSEFVFNKFKNSKIAAFESFDNRTLWKCSIELNFEIHVSRQ